MSTVLVPVVIKTWYVRAPTGKQKRFADTVAVAKAVPYAPLIVTDPVIVPAYPLAMVNNPDDPILSIGELWSLIEQVEVEKFRELFTVNAELLTCAIAVDCDTKLKVPGEEYCIPLV